MTPETFEVDGLAAARFGDLAPGELPVVLVHGAMDRSSGLRRSVRHLQPSVVVTYDRRGYAGSLAAGISTTMAAQVADLLAVIGAVTDGAAVVVGHSLGGLIALHAAITAPDRVVAVGAWEPPMPWEEWYVSAAARAAMDVGDGLDPADSAERFMRSMIGDRLWERLPAEFRAERRAEGATLRADLTLSSAPETRLDLASVTVPVVAGFGSESPERFHLSAKAVAAGVPHGEVYEVQGSSHGVHLSHPSDFAGFVRAVLRRVPEVRR